MYVSTKRSLHFRSCGKVGIKKKKKRKKRRIEREEGDGERRYCGREREKERARVRKREGDTADGAKFLYLFCEGFGPINTSRYTIYSRTAT